MMRTSPGDSENKKPQTTQITQIILALSSWLLALSKQQTRRTLRPGFHLFSFIASWLPNFPASLFSRIFAAKLFLDKNDWKS